MHKVVWDLHFIVFQLLAYALFFAVVEKIRPAQKNVPFYKKELLSETGFACVNAIVNTALIIYLVPALENALSSLISRHPFGNGIALLPWALQLFLGLLVLDFATYLRHRFTHRFMWPFHSIHHNVHEITWLSGYKLHPGEYMVSVIFSTVILYIFGFEGSAITTAIVIASLFNLLAHTNLEWDFGPLRYVFVCPNQHRWHHAQETKAVDKNFAAVFSWIDIIFGTYYYPHPHLPHAYGIMEDVRAARRTIPESFLGQLIYPVKAGYRKFRPAKKSA